MAQLDWKEEEEKKRKRKVKEMKEKRRKKTQPSNCQAKWPNLTLKKKGWC